MHFDVRSSKCGGWTVLDPQRGQTGSRSFKPENDTCDQKVLYLLLENWASDQRFWSQQNYFQNKFIINLREYAGQWQFYRYWHIVFAKRILSVQDTHFIQYLLNPSKQIRSLWGSHLTPLQIWESRRHDIKDLQELWCNIALKKELIGIKFKGNVVIFFIFFSPWKLLLCGNPTLPRRSWFLYLDRSCHYQSRDV